MLLQSGLRMSALINPVTYVCPALTSPGGCSETTALGTTHETAGSAPALAAAKKLLIDWMFPRCPFCRTVSKYGRGFQIPGVKGPCWTGAQDSAESFSQSGSVPVDT